VPGVQVPVLAYIKMYIRTLDVAIRRLVSSFMPIRLSRMGSSFSRTPSIDKVEVLGELYQCGVISILRRDRLNLYRSNSLLSAPAIYYALINQS
jgi:hypothetical protein